jgi:hypothetical protein
MRKRRPICEATLCCIPFKVFACDFGGSFDCTTREIEIGIGRESWEYSVSVLLHEALECAFALKDMRFSNPSHYDSHDSYVFQFNHHQFSDAIEEAGIFVADVMPKLLVAWNRKHKQ